jgi:hypothetical protein
VIRLEKLLDAVVFAILFWSWALSVFSMMDGSITPMVAVIVTAAYLGYF